MTRRYLPILFMLIVTAIPACRYKIVAPSASNTSKTSGKIATSSPTPIESNSDQETKREVIIRSIAVYGWWWSDEQLESNFDADNPPPKRAYIKVDEWNASQPDSPHPNQIDVVCRVENHTNVPVNISLEVRTDFKVASYGTIAPNSPTQETVDQKLREIEWSDGKTIGTLATISILPGEAREIPFKGFHLRRVIQKYLRPSAGDLWPWKLRISATAKSSKGQQIAYAETKISLIPGD